MDTLIDCHPTQLQAWGGADIALSLGAAPKEIKKKIGIDGTLDNSRGMTGST
jgi:hypothetical protein